MLASSVIGPAKDLYPIFRANGNHLSVEVLQREEVSAHEITTTCPKLGATAVIDADQPMNREMARFVTSVTGSGKDPCHLL